MANISAAMVKELREKTGAGMMDCKTALTESGGDIEAGVDWLRKKGLSKAAKKGDRVAAEGLIGAAFGATEAVVVEVNSETDFVARNDDFQTLVRNIAQVALKEPALQAKSDDVAAIKAAPYPKGGTVEAAITHAIATIGENMNLRRAARLSVTKGAIGSYVHGQVSDGLGKIGVLVALESDKDPASLEALGRKIAQHIAAANPIALDSSAIDPDVIAREKAVLMEKNAAGKPANVAEKIVEGGLKTYFKENCLVDQISIHEDHSKKAIGQVAKEAGATITGFVRFGLGEGVEKGEGPDFASEVAAMSSKK